MDLNIKDGPSRCWTAYCVALPMDLEQKHVTRSRHSRRKRDMEGVSERDEGSFVRIILRSYYVFCVRFNNVIAFFGEHREFESG